MEQKVVKAGLFSRFIAALIDSAILFVLVFISLFFLSTDNIFVFVFFLILALVYFVTKDILFGNQSLGKKLLGLECYNVIEQRLANTKEIFIRGAIRLLMTFLFLSLIVDVFAAIADSDNRRFTDHAAGTMIIKKNKS